MYRMWDKSRCDPYNRPGRRGPSGSCNGLDTFELLRPELPNIVSITNILSATANIKIETPRTPIESYTIYVKKYKPDGTYLGVTSFTTGELNPNIPTKDFVANHIYKVYAIAHNKAGDSDKSRAHIIDTTINRINEYPGTWFPPMDIDMIECDIGIDCHDTLICN